MEKLVFITVLVFLSVSSLNYVHTAKILGVFPTPSRSHWIIAHKLMEELALSGHEVTIISPFPVKNPVKNYHDISTPELAVLMNEKMDSILDKIDDHPLIKALEIFDITFDLSNRSLSHPNVKKLINSDAKFDLIFLEIFFNDAMLGFGNHFNAPIIGMSTVGATKWITDLTGSPLPLSYVPNIFLPYSDRMTFGQRLVNAIMSIVENTFLNHITFKRQSELYDQIFPDPKPSLYELKKKGISLGLLNNHFSISFPQPYLPNMIEVGGMHLNTKTKPLPEDLQNFIDSSKDGVIYFSLGSNVQPSRFPKEKLIAIYNALVKLNQRVLFKWDAPEFFKKNDNFLVRNWFPQDDILAHPNVKLFVTHGGLLSCTEAIYHGMPVIGIPVFGDQHMNMLRMEMSGLGVTVQYKNITEEAFDWALNEVVNKPRYQIKAKELSQRFRDQPLTPLETAKFWVEYVIRHKGAPHLISSAKDLTAVQYHSIDVWATLASILLAILVLIILIIKFILRKVFGSSREKKQKFH